MWKTILRRVLLMIPQVIILSVLIFLLAQAMPGEEYIQNQREYYDATGRVYDLRTITTTHKVALKDGGAS